MAKEIKRTFLQGKMQKDVDERIVPDGQYVNALNVQVAKSEGSDVGALENSLGNEQKTFFNLTNAAAVGEYKDDSEQLIYSFVTADEKDLIYEYDDNSGAATVILESTRVNGKTLLNFSKDKLITGIIKIKSGTPENDLLGWTDDNEQPRIINIERAKKYGADGFIEDDVSVIKKPPLYSPTTKLTYVSQGEESNINDKFLSFAYAYRYLDGYMSALSPFTTAAYSPHSFKLDQQTFENEGMQNIFSAVDIEFNTGSKRVTDVMIVFKESNSNIPYVIDTFNKKDNLWGDDENQSFRFSNSKIYRLLDENELLRLYDAVPRKAKAMDLLGNRISFGNYLEGYDLLDKFGERLKMDYNLSLFTKDLTGSNIPYELTALNVENDLVTFDVSAVKLIKNSRLTFQIDLAEKKDRTGTYSGSFDFIINKDYTDIPELANDNDFIGFIQNVLTNDFTQNYVTTAPENSELQSNSNFEIDSYTPTSITLKTPELNYQIDNTPADSTDSNFSTLTSYWGFKEQTSLAFLDSAIDSSCKTNRSYEVAQVYLDEYGRSTTALTSPDNTLYIPQENSVYQNKIRVNVNHRPPAWAKYFRFAIKQNKKEYQTIYASIFYEDGLFRWIKLDGANKDKVEEGDTLIVKSDLSGPINDIVKVRVLEITSKEENFLGTNKDENGNDIVEEAGLYMKIKVGSFDMNYAGDTFKNYTDYDSDRKNNPHVTLGPFGEKNSDGAYTDYPVNPGSEIDIYIHSYEKKYDDLYEAKKTASERYDDFQLFFEAEFSEVAGYVRSYEFFRDGEGKLFMNLQSIHDGSIFNISKFRATINIRFTEGIVIFETEPEDALSDIFYEGSQTFRVIDGSYHEGNIQSQDNEKAAIIELDFFNCYAMGNGVESYRYKDALNSKYLNIDTRATAKSESEYREIRRYGDLLASEPYVENLGINGLNNFNSGNQHYKDDIVKKYGSIQKIYARDTDIIIFQEDKVSRVLNGKELIVGPNGQSNLASVDKIFGSQIPYAGEHGISRNPESMALSGNRIWFTDEKRNQVCRLSIDGITVISGYGLTSHFRDLFTASMNKAKLGAYDPYNEKYVLSARDQEIYNPKISFSCENSIKKKNYKGTLKATIDFGIGTGDVGVNITTDKEITVSLIWNGVEHPITTSGVGTITFEKSMIIPRKAEIIIAAENEDTNFEIQGNCPVAQTLNVISIIRSNAKDAGNIIDNRYKWVAGNYAGPYKHFHDAFIKDGGISVFNKETGKEGIGYIPKTGSQIFMESFKGFGDTGSFGKDDTLGYLVSDTEYTKDDIDVIISESTTASPDAIDTGGGETINKLSFDFLRPNNEKYLYLIWDYSSLSININTYIYIYFDSSGSMNSTLAPLQEMRNTILKAALLPLYENDEAAYNEKVQIVSHSSERTLHMLNFLGGTAPAGNVISLVFQDEAESVYTSASPSWNSGSYPTSTYNTDINTLRKRLNSFAENYYRGVVFQVQTLDLVTYEGGDQIYDNFQKLIPAIQNGEGQYAGVFGLSDRDEFAYKYGVTPGATSEFYKDLIVNTLKELGYNL